MQRLNSYLHAKEQPPYILNLDPAVSHMPYAANIDIRDTVDYKEVMKQYNLGPNGGIMTALNLFTTKFDQVLGFVEKRAQTVKCVWRWGYLTPATSSLTPRARSRSLRGPPPARSSRTRLHRACRPASRMLLTRRARRRPRRL